MIILFLFILIGFFILLLYSPGTVKPYTDNAGKQLPGSVAEKIFIQIGGVKQGMFIKSKNTNNPVLLYLHGGIGFPNYFLIDKFKPGLEDYFTVCYWERRGGGLSYSSTVTKESMNLNQLTEDAIEVTNYLRKRFNKDKIYLFAHSGGTPIGLMTAAKEPGLFHAYIAMGQITNQVASEKLAYEYMLEEYKKGGNQKRIDQLKKFAVSESDSNVIAFFKSGLRDNTMHELGIGTMRNMKSVFRDIFLPVWACKAYTIKEKWNIWKSKITFQPKTNLVNEILKTDFTVMIQQLDIPVYFFSGKYDLTVNINLSKDYFTKLLAPVKGFYTFSNSAHSPLFEEPEKVRRIIEQDILKGKNDWADGKQ
jgi:pimeloyl-ACP methyl ester carboxylesterase